MGLINLLDEVGYISFDDMVNAIHRHIGLDKDIEIAENILLHILDKHIQLHEETITIYNNIQNVWQELIRNPYSEWANYRIWYKWNDKEFQMDIANYQHIIIEIMRERKRQRELLNEPLPF